MIKALLILILSAHALIPNQDLMQRAQHRADTMVIFSHDGYKRSFDNADYTYEGENLAKGFKDATSTFVAFMNSPSHKKNILTKDFKYIGIGYNATTSIIVVLFANK